MSVSRPYESLVEPHLEELRKYCFFLTKSRWDGEDLCQEALLKTMTYFLNKEQCENVRPFLIRVARNLWIDNCRASQRRRRMPLRDFPVCFTGSDYAEVRSLIQWVGERLPRRNIEMLLLSEYFGYTLQEIADTLDCTVPAVKSVLHRTRNMLRKFDWDSDYQADVGNVIRIDVERWSRAIMQDLPPSLL